MNTQQELNFIRLELNSMREMIAYGGIESEREQHDIAEYINTLMSREMFLLTGEVGSFNYKPFGEDVTAQPHDESWYNDYSNNCDDIPF